MQTAFYMVLSWAIIFSTSCESTGSGSSGGLFGWSEAKAQQEIADKQEELKRLEADSKDERQRAEVLDKKKRYLEYQQY